MPGEAFETVNSELSRAEFQKISGLLYAVSRITLQDGKEELVKSRLLKRMRAIGIRSFGEYLARVDGDPAEKYQMVDLLTTNKTSFFREDAHFDFLKTRVLPGLGGGRLRVWSAGCSSGEEPYTIAMVLREYYAQGPQPDARILATDLSKRVLARAEAGTYDEEVLREVPAQLASKYFDCVETRKPRRYSARQALRSLITFAPLNLMEDWPMKGPFDVIFCRNVMIYFDKATQERLVNRFYGLLKPGGYLFSGHSESLAGMNHSFRYVQPAVHLKG